MFVDLCFMYRFVGKVKIVRMNRKRRYFSERNGFVTVSDVIVTGRLTRRALNGISTCFTKLKNALDEADEKAQRSAPWLSFDSSSYYQLGLAAWTDLLGRRQNDYSGYMDDEDAFQKSITDSRTEWYRVLDLIEFAIDNMSDVYSDADRIRIKERFVMDINRCFEKENVGYRVIDGCVVEIVSETEVESLEEVTKESQDIVANHFNQALVLYSQRPDPDFRNSIKEAVTALEALCRSITGESTFGKAYSRIKADVTIHPRLQEMIQKLYDYTNQPDTGIRHSKVSADDNFLPDSDDCRFVLVVCSAVINYIQAKSQDVDVS